MQTLENKDFRIDSQFFTQQPIKNPKLKYDIIGNCLINAQYGISISMNEDGIGYPIYRMNEIHSMMCDSEVNKNADISNTELATFELNDRDVLFNRTNSFEWVGRTGIYRKLDDRKFVFASYLVRFIPDQSKIIPEYLTTFLNSKAGVKDIKRRARQSINQTNVNPEEVKAIEIPLLSLTFQDLIKDCFNQAHSLLIKSKRNYKKAEQLLLQELKLDNFSPCQEPVNVKSFTESFGTSGRLDAEYYQVKYDDYLQAVENYSGGSDSISSSCDVKIKNFTPSEKVEYKYIELSNIGKTGDITGCTINFGKELPSRARRLVSEGDVVISSIEGSLDSCALVTKEYDQSLCSTGFYVINSDVINSETLLVLFKSELMQNILKQNCSGTILTAINKDEFFNINIPLIVSKVQKQIKELITESFSLKKESEHLLDIAKFGVEMAIEQDEKQALTFINRETKE